MKKESSWNYYGVKLIKHIVVSGEPDKDLIDEFYDESGEQEFEESVLLIHAQSFDHAYKLAEKRAAEDNIVYKNVYGQQVEWRFIEAVDCFLICDELKSGAEVYSCIYTADPGISADEFLQRQFGDPADE